MSYNWKEHDDGEHCDGELGDGEHGDGGHQQLLFGCENISQRDFFISQGRVY